MQDKIRRFKKSDAGQVAKIISACIANFNDIDEKTRRFLLSENSVGQTRKKLSKRDVAYVYELKGEIVGVGAVNKNQITRAYVEPKRQNKGIGASLIKVLEWQVKENGFKAIKVEASTEAEGFYKKLGFKTVGKFQKKDGGNLFTLVKMQKNLI